MASSAKKTSEASGRFAAVMSRHAAVSSHINIFILLLICGVMMSPILSIFVISLGDTADLIPHLFHTVLPRYLANTVILMAGVGAVACVIGVGAAWIVTRYRFTGRRLFDFMLVLPAAMPAYISAYAYTDFLEYSGPVQTALRQIFGWRNAQDYWFFEIRSMGGAIIMLGFVLYPYVYLLARTAFRQTSSAFFEVALLSGKPLFSVVALPLARPAIVAGLSLVLMEVISDFGTVDYFAIETLTLGIFNVWLGMGSVASAARLALFAFILIAVLISVEMFARSRRSFHNQASNITGVPSLHVTGWAGLGCITLCAIPVSVGFAGPVLILLSFILSSPAGAPEFTELLALTGQSLGLAGSSAVVIVAIAVVMAFLSMFGQGRWARILSSLAATGYAFPGTILAIGVLYVFGIADKLLSGLSFTMVISGTIFVLIFGLSVRFLAVGLGAVASGIEKLPPHMMESSRILGQGYLSSVRKVILPQLRPALLVGGLLVFVDVMKELPLTLLLRPFSFETFATFTYQFAKDEMLEVAALPALFIIIAGLIPVYLANYALSGRNVKAGKRVQG